MISIMHPSQAGTPASVSFDAAARAASRSRPLAKFFNQTGTVATDTRPMPVPRIKAAASPTRKLVVA